jgi:hypothetical protein
LTDLCVLGADLEALGFTAEELEQIPTDFTHILRA